MNTKKPKEEVLKIEPKSLAMADLLPPTEAVYEIDLDGKFTFANQRAFELFGYCWEDLEQGADVPQMFVPEDRERLKQNMERALAGEELGFTEYTALRKDGSTFPIMIHSTCVVDDGKVVGLRGLIIDLTERKQTEKAIHRSEKRFQELVELLPEAVYEIDLDGRFTFANQKAFEISGYDREDLDKGLNALQLFIPEDHVRVKQNIAKILAGEELGPTEYTALRKDGSTFPVMIHSSRIIDDGKVVGLRGIIMDLTERKRTETDLRESEERFRAIFQGAAEGILVADVATKELRYANPVICSLLGYPEEELIGMTVPDIHPKDSLQHVLSEFEAQARGEKTLSSDIPCLRRDGTIIYADINATKICMDGRECNVGFFTDTTERRRREAENAELQENLRIYASLILRNEEERRNHFARELHDVTIQELLLTTFYLHDIHTGIYGRVPVDAQEHIENVRLMISETADSLRRSVQAIKPAILDDADLVSELRQLASTMMAGSGISVEVRVIGRKRSLTQEINLALLRITQEALSNIRKHAGTSIAAIVLEFTKEKVIMSITDDGIGFEMPSHETYFAREGKLGLIGMNERARITGGICRVESEPGKGTVVRVEIPIQDQRDS